MTGIADEISKVIKDKSDKPEIKEKKKWKIKFNPDRALLLPDGGVRSILAVLVIGSACFAVLSGITAPEWFIGLVSSIMVFYYGKEIANATRASTHVRALLSVMIIFTNCFVLLFSSPKVTIPGWFISLSVSIITFYFLKKDNKSGTKNEIPS